MRRFLILALWVGSSLFARAAGAQVIAGELYWLDTNYANPTLNKADPVGTPILSVALPAGTLPEGLATDAGGKVYWAEAATSGARVQRAAPTLGGITTLVSGGSVLRGIAIDDVAGMIYWTTSNLATGSSIRRSALDGSGVTTILSLGAIANPRGIAVDHAGGKLYWADFDQDAIYTANLDGSSMAWVTLPSGSHPYGVAFNPSTSQLFWTEYAGKIRRVDSFGGPQTALLGGLSNPTYITLDPVGGQLYWSEGGAGNQHIYVGPMTGGSRTALALPLTTYGGLAFQTNGIVSTPDAPLPGDFALAPLHPNPSRGAVRAEFALPRESHVRITVIDLQGREVAVLADGAYPAGRHQASWNASARVPAGIYFVRLTTDGRAFTRRLVLAG